MFQVCLVVIDPDAPQALSLSREQQTAPPPQVRLSRSQGAGSARETFRQSPGSAQHPHPMSALVQVPMQQTLNLGAEKDLRFGVLTCEKILYRRFCTENVQACPNTWAVKLQGMRKEKLITPAYFWIMSVLHLDTFVRDKWLLVLRVLQFYTHGMHGRTACCGRCILTSTCMIRRLP